MSPEQDSRASASLVLCPPSGTGGIAEGEEEQNLLTKKRLDGGRLHAALDCFTIHEAAVALVQQGSWQEIPMQGNKYSSNRNLDARFLRLFVSSPPHRAVHTEAHPLLVPLAP